MGDGDGTGYTVDEALSAVGFGRFQYIALAFAGLGWISDAMETMLLSFIGPALQSEWDLSAKEEDFLTTVVLLGMLFGAYFWGFIADAHGRRRGFIGADGVIFASGILSSLAPSYSWLLFFQCLLGMGVGGVHVFASWFLEFIPTSGRGSWMVAISSFWTLGTILEASLAWIAMPRLGWRWLLALSSIPSLTVLLISPFLPESPRFLCSKGRTIEAQRVLEKMAQLNRTVLPTGLLLSDQTTELCEDPSEELLLQSSTNKTKSYRKTYLKSSCELFSSKLLRTTLLLWVVYFNYTFLYHGIVLITSQLSIGQHHCGSIRTIHPNVQNSNLYVDTFITSIAELPGFIIVASVVDKLGRKLTVQVMTMSTFVVMLPLLWRQNWTVTTVLLFLARMFISGGFSIANIYSKEVYPTSARTTGDGVANAMGRIGGMVCPLVTVWLVRGCHQTADTVALSEFVLLVSGLSILFFPIETKGRGLADTTEDTE